MEKNFNYGSTTSVKTLTEDQKKKEFLFVKTWSRGKEIN